MKLNLIHDRWIPVLDRSGGRRVIAPWEIADAEILRPDWPRADLNLACLEFLIGLVFMADPPADIDDWELRQSPDPVRLQTRLSPYAGAFNLVGEGPLFLQDLEPLAGAANPPDMLFIDSAGANAARNNADLMVRRGRYDGLDLPTAAMALFAFQAHAPSGGAGNRTSMRGGGPLVTLVDPGKGVWALVWANVPEGAASAVDELPWMRPTVVSDKNREVMPPEGRPFSVEAFFGMPRRLRLLAEGERITGVVQRPWGTKYAVWQHPLSPYYRQKEGDVALPTHPRAGAFGYRHWLGVLVRSDNQALAQRAACVEDWANSRGVLAGPANVIVAGWAMDNMKPRDFIYAVQPFVKLDRKAAATLVSLVHAAEHASVALRGALKSVLGAGEAREAEREGFFIATEPAFLDCLEALKSGAAPEEAGKTWLRVLRNEALGRFDTFAVPGLDQRDPQAIEGIVQSRRHLTAMFAGYGKAGTALYQTLRLEIPAAQEERA